MIPPSTPEVVQIEGEPEVKRTVREADEVALTVKVSSE
jgi:hypothetical protein